MERVSLILCFMLALAFGLSPLGTAKTKIEVWVGHDSWVPYLLHFNSVQDEYEIDYMIQGSKDAMIVAVAAGTPPDVFRTGHMLDLAARGMLTPLDKYIQRDDVDLGEYIPGIMRSPQWAGHTYALPLNGDSNLLYYNYDRFEEAGLDSAAPPSTWSVLELMARRLTIGEPDGRLNQAGFSWTGKNEQFITFLHQRLDGILNADLTDIAFDNEQTLSVVNWHGNSQDYANGGNLRVTEMFDIYGGFHEAFVAGALAMDVRPPASIATMRVEAPETRYGIASIPIPDENGKRVSVSGGHRVTIPVGAKSPEGAWQFIKWLTSYEAGMEFAKPGFTQRYIDQAYQGIGQSMSARIAVNRDSPFYRQPLWREFAQDMIYAIEYPVHPLHESFVSMLRTNTFQVLDHHMSAEEALAHAVHQAKVQWAEWK